MLSLTLNLKLHVYFPLRKLSTKHNYLSLGCESLVEWLGAIKGSRINFFVAKIRTVKNELA
jgi:hypothetical protein